ncbi:MAG: aminodeoxychorismate lyase [Gammaproteobacteria bacterium]
MIATTDRGLAYGDGVFETIAVHNGIAQQLDRHIARLTEGCLRLGFTAPPLVDDIRDRAAGHARAVLKVIVTRGEGGRGYRPPADPVPTRVISLHAWPTHDPAWAERGVAVRWCETRLAIQPALARLKHLNRLEQVLARAEWEGMDRWQEGLMQDMDGHVIEAIQANVFVVTDGRLRTPRVDRCGIAGITRERVIEGAAELGLVCEEARFDQSAVGAADELFLCNSVIGIWPVREVSSVSFDAPGPVTRTLQAWLEQ